jgi:TonB family protein
MKSTILKHFNFKQLIMSKKLILTLVTILFIGLTAFAQTSFPNDRSRDLDYIVHGTYSRPIKKEKLMEAKSLSDIIDDYPKKWITSYTSVEISATCQGKAMKAMSPNENLSPEQKNILNTIDLASDIVINVKYNYKYPLTNTIENNTMHVVMTVVPETEAEYVGGYQQMITYLKEKCSTIIPKKTPNKIHLAIRFTINEGGEITNAKITDTSGDAKTDKLLLEVISNMPKWRPAENIKGIKVKQEFKFSVGNEGGC